MPVKIYDKDYGFQRIDLDVKRLRDRSVKIGIIGGNSRYDNSDESEAVTVVDYAIFNEFGTDTIPERPFMATTHARYSDQIAKFTDFMVQRMIDGKISDDTLLQNIGLRYQGLIRKTIREAKTWAAPNAERTIAEKGSSSPLIDTGRLIQAVNYEVK